MTFVPKDWQDSPSTATPITAAALEDLETRLAAYADSLGGGGVASILVSWTGTEGTNLGASQTLTLHSTGDVGLVGTLSADLTVAIASPASGRSFWIDGVQHASAAKHLYLNVGGAGAVEVPAIFSRVPVGGAFMLHGQVGPDGTTVHVTVDGATGVLISDIAITGTPTGLKFLRDDGSWQVPAGGTSDVTTAVLAADVSLNASSTTLQDVTGLNLAITASATEAWLINVHLMITGNTTADLKVGWTFPSGFTMKWGTLNIWTGQSSGSTPVTPPSQTNTQSYGMATGQTTLVQLTGLAHGGGNSGTLQLQAAQVTSDASVPVILKDSCLVGRRIAT